MTPWRSSSREDYGEFVRVPDVRETIRTRVKTPALFLYGSRDAYAGQAEFYRAKNCLPASQEIVFKQSGQLPFLDKPDRFEEVVVGLLKEIGTVKPALSRL